MSWMPHLLDPLPAAIAAVAAGALLLVLYFLKLRRKEMPVASTLLWKKAIQDLQVNAPFQRLRRNLLFFLQLLVLLLLCLALARPITFFTPGAGKNTVILIDRSASMNATDPDLHGHTRLDEAKRQAKDIVDSLPRGGVAMVIAFDTRAETVQSFTADQGALKNAIDAIQPTDRQTRLKLAYQLAQAQTNLDPETAGGTSEQPDVFVFSDGRVLDPGELAIRANVQYRPIGTDTAKNIGIVALSAKRNYERPTEVQIFARLANYGSEPVTNVPVDLRVSEIDPATPGAPDNFRLRGSATVDLPPERWDEKQRDEAQAAGQSVRDSVQFTLDLTSAAVIRVEQKQTDGDCLAADDSAQVLVPPPKPLSVCLVTDGDWFMERLMGSLNLHNPQIITPQQYEQKFPTADVIIFDRGYAPAKLPAAGNFIYFGGTGPGLKLQPFTDNKKTVMIEDTGVLDWKRDHPILRGITLNKLRVVEAEKLNVPPEAEVLVDGIKGPLVVLDHEGRSTHLVVAFDLLQSNWPTGQVSFPLFMYNALQYLAVGTDLGVSQSYSPGDTPRIPRSLLVQAANDTGQPDLKSIRLNGPGGSRTLPIPAAGEFALPALDRVGVYSTDPVIPKYERIVVNLLDANESNLVPITDKPPGNIGVAVNNKSQRSRLDLWWWIVACCALPLLMIEWYVYTRRVHL